LLSIAEMPRCLAAAFPTITISVPSRLHVDASLIAAKASRNSMVELVVRREVRKLDEQEVEPDSGSTGPLDIAAARLVISNKT
jgi:hypothetical protein